jgi:hypothetical protein
MRSWTKAAFAAGFLLALPAQAQTPAVSDQVIAAFIESHSAVSRLDKIARWEEGVCPSLTGLPANFTKFILKRVREVAAQVGAPVNPDENCKANIDIVFTTNPQALLDSVRAKQPVMLGYFQSSAQADRMAQVNHVIQGWHAIQSVDLRGKTEVDNMYTNSALAVTGNRLGNGLHSSYYRAIIVADPNKLGNYEIGTLADAITMLALAQPAQEDACTDLPSILDMTNPACRKDKPAVALTAADTGYLRGLYKVDPGASLGVQKDGIAFHIKEALAK